MGWAWTFAGNGRSLARWDNIYMIAAAALLDGRLPIRDCRFMRSWYLLHLLSSISWLPESTISWLSTTMICSARWIVERRCATINTVLPTTALLIASWTKCSCNIKRNRWLSVILCGERKAEQFNINSSHAGGRFLTDSASRADVASSNSKIRGSTRRARAVVTVYKEEIMR